MEESNIAFCQLDSFNKDYIAYLTEHFFILKKGTKEDYYPRSFLRKVSISKKKMLMPLVSGGILASLSLISIIVGIYYPWFVLITLTLGAFLLYYGYRGKEFLIISEEKNENSYLIKDQTDNLKNFLKFVNSELIESSSFLLYHIVSEKDWNDQLESNWYKHSSLDSEGFIHCALKEQINGVLERFFKNQKDLLILFIDPKKLNAKVKFEKAVDVNDIFPHVYGAINKEAIQNTETIQNNY